jgi:LysM repeat protein
MNKRYVLKNRKRFYIFIMILTVALTSILIVGTVSSAGADPVYTSVTVEKGDTLWEIAKKYRKNGDIRRFINEIEKVNDISDSTIYERDVLRLPL